MLEPQDKLNPVDSIYYSKQMISWPPQGYCPRMFFFKKWSISGKLDFEGATVTIQSKSIGKLPCKTNIDKARMLPYSTLVFEPEISSNFYETLKDGEAITVTISKKGKKVYSYQTILFDTK